MRVTDYMVTSLKEALEEADTLGTAIWGGVQNIKSQPVLNNRKNTLSNDLEKIIRYLTQLQKDVEDLKMVGHEDEE